MLAQSLHTTNFSTDLLYYVRAPWEPEHDCGCGCARRAARRWSTAPGSAARQEDVSWGHSWENQARALATRVLYCSTVHSTHQPNLLSRILRAGVLTSVKLAVQVTLRFLCTGPKSNQSVSTDVEMLNGSRVFCVWPNCPLLFAGRFTGEVPPHSVNTRILSYTRPSEFTALHSTLPLALLPINMMHFTLAQLRLDCGGCWRRPGDQR